MVALRINNLNYAITFALLCFLPLVLLPETAWLLVPQEEGELMLMQGKQLYKDGHFDEAIDKLTLAIKVLKDKDKLIDANLHLALCHFALAELDKAKEYLADLLRINPAQNLDPMFYPPDFLQLFEETKGMILAHIKVETEPPEARLFLDEELVGVTPIELAEVAAGDHRLRIEKEGYKPQEESIILKQGEEKSLSFKLEKKEEKKPVVAVMPPEKKPEVKKGKGWLWILLGAAAAAAVAILATRGGKETAGPTPTPQAFGSIQVKSYLNGASIFLDGEDTGLKTNHTLTNILTGRHTILLRLSGWKDWQEEVTVQPNQTAVVKPCLLPPNGCFRDNFQDGDADGWEFWGAGWNIATEGGNYLLEGKSTSTKACNAIPECSHLRNFVLKFRLKVLSIGRGENVTVSFRYANRCFYSFNIGSNQIWCGKHFLEADEFFDIGARRRSISKGQWYNIEIVAQGDNMQLIINNNLILNIYDHDERIGKGFILLSSNDGCHAQIDDVVITSEACP
jgi:hypothetical protein